MAAEPRSVLIDPNEVGVYHCYNRCVRRAYLCGVDQVTGKSHDHRKDWIVERLATLARGFAVEVLDYCTMDNHLHLLLRNRPDLVKLWDDREVAERWCCLCPSELEKLERQQARRQAKSSVPLPAVDVREQYLTMLMNDQAKICELRTRLSDISWLMKLLCEQIARRANREDEVTGKFWENRFQSDRILDEAHALACSMYINLNPVRAQQAIAPELCSHTSLGTRMASIRDLLLSDWGPEVLGESALGLADMAEQEDVEELVNREFDEALAAPVIDLEPSQIADSVIATTEDSSVAPELEVGPIRITKRASTARRRPGGRAGSRSDAWLSRLSLREVVAMEGDSPARAMAMANRFPAPRASNKGFLPISLADYLRLIDWTGRQPVHGKRGAIPAHLAPIQERLRIDLASWPELVSSFGQKGRTARGSVEALEREALRRKRKWIRGKRSAPRTASALVGV